MATYHYRFTYVDSDGKETGPSNVKSITESGTAAKVRIYNVPREDLLNITSRKIYRSTATTSASPALNTFKLLTTITGNDWAQYTDNLASVSSGAAMPTETNFGSGTSASANVVQYGAVTNANQTTSAIANFPAEWYRAVILYAAKKLCDKKLMDMRDSLATLSDSSDGGHADPAEASQGWEKVRYYIEDDEDVELASAKAQAMTAEQQQFALDYKWLQSQRQIIAQEYDQMFQFEGMTRGQDET
tara:strand:- start:135 stop:869 length:735 start_codon:yes stop_codon:yes gene_type:complete